jgi:hypothetical protein
MFETFGRWQRRYILYVPLGMLAYGCIFALVLISSLTFLDIPRSEIPSAVKAIDAVVEFPAVTFFGDLVRDVGGVFLLAASNAAIWSVCGVAIWNGASVLYKWARGRPTEAH